MTTTKTISFSLRLIYSHSVDTVIAVIFGRETEVQNGVKDDFAEATRIGFKGREVDIPTLISAIMLQCKLFAGAVVHICTYVHT